ncbi:ATP-dependent helicase [bacterium CPR1]|nr:ATP-dependent helicase [bacterium CPR1]
MTAPAIDFSSTDLELVLRLANESGEAWSLFTLRQEAERLSLVEGFEELLCLVDLQGVERMPHQERTALRVMRRLRGRAILGDEVGLGKTVEAGLIVKEYLLRGLARRVLVLCPPSLIQQWQQELAGKFRLSFVSSEDEAFRELGEAAWSKLDRVVASLPLARLDRHRLALQKAGGYDLVVVDESHCLRRRTSKAWRLVHDLPRKYLLLLTATPLQNDLEELYNLITLLRPGQLGTPSQFRQAFVDPSDRRRPRNIQALRELMLDVMVRNTRASVNLVLPPRRARTLRLAPGADELRLNREVQRLVHEEWGQKRFSRMALRTLQLQVGSSPAALSGTLERMGLTDLARQAADLQLGAKVQAVRQVLQSLHSEPVLIFSRFVATLEALQGHLPGKVHSYHGGLSVPERERQLESFRQNGGVLLLSEVGGEGKNLQFCRHLINFDLPWNPLRIEQRVGRVHRIGQTKPIEIVNLCLEGSLEDHLLRILDDKLNMFELVLGELEMILGPLEDECDFEELLAELAAGSANQGELESAMAELGRKLSGLEQSHREHLEYDSALFGREFEVGEDA